MLAFCTSAVNQIKLNSKDQATPDDFPAPRGEAVEGNKRNHLAGLDEGDLNTLQAQSWALGEEPGLLEVSLSGQNLEREKWGQGDVSS